MSATDNIIKITETELLCNRIAAIGFMLLTLFFGLRVKRAKTLKEYALAGRSLGAGAVLMTLAATLLSSRSIWINRMFRHGGVVMIMPIVTSIAIVVVGFYFLPKLLFFEGEYTLSGVMKKIYGHQSAQVSSLLGVTSSFMIILAQFCFIGKLAYTIGISRNTLIVITGIVVTAYTLLGSMRSVAITDVLQMLCILGGTISLLLFSWNDTALPTETPSTFSKQLDFWDQPFPLSSYFLKPLFWGFWPTLVIMPPVVQRVLMLRSKKTVQSTFFGVSLINILFATLTFLVANYAAKCAVPTNLSELTGSAKTSGTQYVIDIVCKNPIGKSAFLLTMLSIFVSTIDSFLHSSALELACFCTRLQTKKIEDKRIIQASTLFTFLLGSFAILITVNLNEVIVNELVGYAILLFSVMVVPFLAGISGLKGNRKIFFFTLGTYFLVHLCLKNFLDKDMVLSWVGKSPSKNAYFEVSVFYWLFSLVLSTIVFFIAHYLTYGHFVIVHRDKNRLIKHQKHSLTFTWLKSPIRWAKEKAEQYGMSPYALGVFLYLTLMVPYLYLGGNQGEQMRAVQTILVLRVVGGLLVTAMLLESLWPKKMYRRYFPLFYYATIFFCVPFLAIMTTFQDPNGEFAIPNVVLAIILLILLVDWRTFLGFFALAFLVSSLYYKSVKGAFIPAFDDKKGFVLIMSILYSLLVCLIFARKKQLRSYLHSKRLTLSKERSKAQFYVEQDLHQQLAMTVDARSSVMREVETIAYKVQAGASDKEDGKKLKKIIAHLTDIQKKSLEYLPLEATKTSWDVLSQDLLQSLEDLQLEEQVSFSESLQSDDFSLVADISYLQRLLINAIQHIAKYHPEQVAYCHIDETTLHYEVKDKVQEIPAYRIIVANQEIDHTTQSYYPSKAMPYFTKDTKHLSENYRITLAHYGSMIYQEGDTYVEQVYVIPKNIHLVRPKITALVDEDLLLQTKLTASEDEAFLWQASRKRLHIPTMEKALRICKHYHRHQKRKSGEAFYLHPLAVATILLNYVQDDNTIVAALLHDVIEDTAYTLEQIEASFNPEVAHIVAEVSNIYNKKNRKLKLTKKEKFKNMLEKSDSKSLLVKLADRLHNMRTLASKSKERQVSIAQETLDFFVPVAKHLNQPTIEEELVALAQHYIAKKIT